MTETASAIFDVCNDQSKNVMLKIWSKSGAMFQDIFSIENTTFAYVKCLAMKFLLKSNSNNLSTYDYSIRTIRTNEMDNYKLISIETKKIIDEQKTLSQEDVKDGDEYLLAKKVFQQPLRDEQV
ncbi:unnamed protein product [Rotaria sp. Silwood1]|nr:unnamed protein product [Rotaria sp. Silwood1]